MLSTRRGGPAHGVLEQQASAPWPIHAGNTHRCSSSTLPPRPREGVEAERFAAGDRHVDLVVLDELGGNGQALAPVLDPTFRIPPVPLRGEGDARKDARHHRARAPDVNLD